MPEGPEVLTTVGMMHFYMAGKILSGMEFLSGKHSEDEPDDFSLFIDCLPLKIDKVYCKGKLIVIQLSNPNDSDDKWWILNHLVMTGSWQLKCKESEEDHIRCRMKFEVTEEYGVLDITSIDFLDVRDFGKFNFINDKAIVNSTLSEIADGFIGDYLIDFETFESNIRKSKKASLISKLRDQKSICSGIGNYLISEIMYDAGLSHLLKCDELSTRRIVRLYESCKSIITLSYQKGGLSIENYVDINGDKGTFEPFLKVYRKDGKSGRGTTDLHGNRVLSIKKGQTFWYVPGLQRREDTDHEESDEEESDEKSDNVVFDEED